MLPVLFVLAFLTGNSIASRPILGPVDGNSVDSEGDWSTLRRHAAAFAADRRVATGVIGRFKGYHPDVVLCTSAATRTGFEVVIWKSICFDCDVSLVEFVIEVTDVVIILGCVVIIYSCDVVRVAQE
jgi:hypothetical protein